MATLDSGDANILDTEAINLRWIVYSLLAILVLLVGGFGLYYHRETQRIETEGRAREALVEAKTPEALGQVADQFPGTDQAALALLSAAEESFGKRDFEAATKDYQRIIEAKGTNAQLRDSARMGLASSFEATGNLDGATTTYLEVGRRGSKTFYSPYAYSAAARIYEQRGDKDNERKILTEVVGLGIDSPFVQQAQAKLKELNTPAGKVPPASPTP